MANERIYMQCRVCKEKLIIFKYYPDNSYLWCDNDGSEAGKFFDKHLICAHELPESSSINVGSYAINHIDELFRLVTETDLMTEEG